MPDYVKYDLILNKQRAARGPPVAQETISTPLILANERTDANRAGKHSR
jgi:hypothetical protein